MKPTGFQGMAGVLRRYPFCVVSTVIAFLGAAAALYFWQHAELIADAHADTEKQYGEMLDIKSAAPALRAELAHVKEFTRRIDENLLVEGELSNNKAYFYSLGEKTGAEIVTCEAAPAPPLEEGEIYRKIPFSLKVSGTYEQVAAFLQGVETGPRLSAITSFAIRRTGEPPSPLVMLDLGVIQLARK